MFDQPKILEGDEPRRDSARCRTEMKAQQLLKIKELKEELIASGFLTLDQQAKALGLARSTTWTVLGGKHKNSGLSVATINCIVNNPKLPPTVRTKLLEYIKEKSAGLYGHSKTQRRKFVARLGGLTI
jgi:hypothetical protein